MHNHVVRQNQDDMTVNIKSSTKTLAQILYKTKKNAFEKGPIHSQNARLEHACKY